MDAIDILVKEHRHIERVMDVLERAVEYGRGTDVVLPGGQGLEVVRTARELRTDTPVLVVTGQVNSLASEAARSLGASRVLGKPLRAAERSRLNAVDAD